MRRVHATQAAPLKSPSLARSLSRYIVPAPLKLTLLYLANDVLQKARKQAPTCVHGMPGGGL